MTIDSGFAAVLFDLDGTLVDTAPDRVDALSRLMATLGAPAYGYITDDDDPFCRDADVITADIGELVRLLRNAVDLDS